jgi:stage III sporulation protein AE
MIRLASDSIHTLSDYGKLLLPVMTTALAAQGGIQTSTALFTATALFDTVLCTLIRQILVPMIYVYLALGITACVTNQTLIKQLKGFMKWAASWCLKLLMYIFTGYISITGVVAGTTDAAALKATKITISGMIPVVGGILSDASESVIVGAAALKNGIGVYGLLAIIAVTVGPFLQIGSHYLLLKLTFTFSLMVMEKAASTPSTPLPISEKPSQSAIHAPVSSKSFLVMITEEIFPPA